MKRKLLVGGFGLVLVLSLASVASAFLGLAPPPGVGDFCTSNGNFGVAHDTCVVCVNKGNNGQVCICKLLQDLGLLGNFGFTNFGDCVSQFAKM
jgi:hypothetical protein